MASSRFTAPMRGVSCPLGRLSVRQRHDALSARCTLSRAPATACLCTPPSNRSITTSTASRASVSDITTSVDDAYIPVIPFEKQKVLATIHRFPSLEPLRFEKYPANHLYLPTRRDILHRAVIYEGDNTRLGTASTKTRHEVHGSRKKVRPQKGSGRARLGDKKSPMLRGGGVAFGPKPRDFGTQLPKKVYDLAWRTALSYRFRKGELIIVDNAIELESPSTRLLEDVFTYQKKQLGKGRSLLVTLDERPFLEEALAEVDREGQALTWEDVDVKNLLELSRVIIEREALHNILLSHEEDITHKALTPWHKSLIRSSPPKDLQSIPGWQEFRDLLDSDVADSEKDLLRAKLYEESATKRYTHAESLPPGDDRTAYQVSAYRLLADAKEMHLARATGLPFEDFKRRFEVYTRWTSGKYVRNFESTSPRLLALGRQIRQKQRQADRLAETSQTESEVAAAEVWELEVEKQQFLYDTALLVAQIQEHRAEADALEDFERAADAVLQSRRCRKYADRVEDNLLQAKLELGNQKLVVAELKGVGRRAALNEIQEVTEVLEARQAEIEARSGRSRQGVAQLEEMIEEQDAEADAPAEIEASNEAAVEDAKMQEPVEAVKVQDAPVIEVKAEESKSQEKR